MLARKREKWRSYLTEEERNDLIFLERREADGIEARSKQFPIIEAAKAREKAATVKYEFKGENRIGSS